MLILWLLTLLAGCVDSGSSQLTGHWMKQGQEALKTALKLRHTPNEGVAKNVILFLGDGMGVSTVTAARIYKGQLNGQTGEETQLNFEKFPHVGLSKTYNVDMQVPDSAATATAFLAGVKANFGTLGVDARVTRENCSLFPQGKVDSILDWAIAAGKSVGLVTTTPVTHATPAASYAHTPERKWEGDAAMEDADDLCKAKVKDIALQLVEDAPNKDIRVILGGGRQFFLPISEYNTRGRLDGRDLVEMWRDDKTRRGRSNRFVTTRQQLADVDTNNTDYLLGLFSWNMMDFDLKRNDTGAIEEPSLAEMTRAAVGVLENNPNGFFLFVEGGRIDHGHHINNAHLALGDTIAFDDAVAVAKEMTGDDTLMVVTADHSHVFTISGYPDRGHDILGIQEVPFPYGPHDGMPYSTLSYANGPGPSRINLTGVDTTSTTYQQSRLVPMNYETHAGEDVAIYATGPMAHLFHGVHEQNYIAHAMAYAACVGPNKDHCTKRPPSQTPDCTPGGAAQAFRGYFIVAWTCLAGLLAYSQCVD